jgi:ribosomal protein S18 acetylase RimI-like enzyme
MSTTAPTAIRRATPADASTVLELLLELADHEDSTPYVHVDSDAWRGLLSNPDVVVFLAEHDGHPVGYVSSVVQLNLWQGRHLLALDDLYVRAEHRGQHVGEDLMRALARHARAAGHQLIRWELETDNAGARRFYQRLGATVRDKSVATWQPSL